MPQYKAIDRFCKMLEALPDKRWSREDAIDMPSLAVGFVQRRNQVPYDPEVPMGSLYEPITVDDLRSKLLELAHRGVSEHVLIMGLRSLMAWHLSGIAADDGGSLARTIDRLKLARATAPDLREPKIDDRHLDKMIATSEAALASSPESRKEASEAMATIDEAFASTFSPEYWTEKRGSKPICTSLVMPVSQAGRICFDPLQFSSTAEVRRLGWTCRTLMASWLSRSNEVWHESESALEDEG